MLALLVGPVACTDCGARQSAPAPIDATPAVAPAPPPPPPAFHPLAPLDEHYRVSTLAMWPIDGGVELAVSRDDGELHLYTFDAAGALRPDGARAIRIEGRGVESVWTGQRLVLLTRGPNRLVRVDPQSGTVDRALPLSFDPRDLALATDGSILALGRPIDPPNRGAVRWESDGSGDASATWMDVGSNPVAFLALDADQFGVIDFPRGQLRRVDPARAEVSPPVAIPARTILALDGPSGLRVAEAEGRRLVPVGDSLIDPGGSGDGSGADPGSGAAGYDLGGAPTWSRRLSDGSDLVSIGGAHRLLRVVEGEVRAEAVAGVVTGAAEHEDTVVVVSAGSERHLQLFRRADLEELASTLLPCDASSVARVGDDVAVLCPMARRVLRYRIGVAEDTDPARLADGSR